MPLLAGWWLSTKPYQGPVTDHFDGNKFFNPDAPPTKGFADVFKWMRNRKKGSWSSTQTTPALPEAISDSLRLYYVNHSTFLIQINQLNILTDPVWSDRVSPFSFMGPKRQHNAGIDFQYLPKIDLVLLSHNHYDHLDLNTLVKLEQRDKPDFITSLGVKTALTALKLSNITELDWWDSLIFKGLQITCTRAQHFSGRGFFDRDKSLWAGFSIRTDYDHLLFVGDSGYGDFFQEFPAKLPPIDLALIPIGAYKPTWFMQPIHCSPKEAIQIHFDIQATKSIACHFGTFPLGDDGMHEAVEELVAERTSVSLAEDAFLILKNGDSLIR